VTEGAGAPSGAALVAVLEARFGAVAVPVRIGETEVGLLRPPAAEDLISEEDFGRDERLPYWAELWPSAVVLAGRVAAERGDGRSLLELGCGLGLVSLAALRAGYRVTATDYYLDALAFTRANAWRAVGREPATRAADWRALPGDLGRHDRVVAADVLYERTYAALVAVAVALTLADGGVATVADPGRVALSAFVDECQARGLAVVQAERLPYADGRVRQEITVLTLAQRSPSLRGEDEREGRPPGGEVLRGGRGPRRGAARWR
jgi:predicted nicotinamide N-methyase